MSELSEFLPNVLRGLWVTAYLTVLSAGCGTMLGIVLSGAVGREKAAPIRLPATAFVEIVRAVPPLVWLIWTYFVLPILFDVRLGATLAAFLVFTSIHAAFAADIFRGARDSIPTSTIESALALGLTEKQVRQRIIVPEIVKRSFAALNGLTVGLLKMSSLASVIAVPELTYSFQIIVSRKPLPLEVYTGMAVAYCLLIFPLVWLLRYLEKLDQFSIQPRSHA